MSYLTSEAKAKLSSTIRELRDRLLTDIHDAADSIYRFSLPIDKAGLDEEQRVKRSRFEQWLNEQDRDSEIARLETEKLAAATFLNRTLAKIFYGTVKSFIFLLIKHKKHEILASY